ncbi:MAG: hypothetical protein ACC635_00445 [Acidiferrobacterales bacterium]
MLSSDGSRAQSLIETLITEPDNQKRLFDVTLNKSWSAKNITPVIHGQNTFKYLRARIKQDQVLDYKVSRQTSLENNRSYFEVAVVESFPGILRKKKFTYVFRVHFEKNSEGLNVITGSENMN